jgi:hypothetical protein
VRVRERLAELRFPDACAHLGESLRRVDDRAMTAAGAAGFTRPGCATMARSMALASAAGFAGDAHG